MRALKVDDENLRNQRDVVKEEVRVNVMNQPYGGFPWLDMPPVAFRNWANAHNFYGDFADLDAATLADVQEFFKTYYVPNNAVLLMLGDVKPEEGFALAKKYFADIPAGRAAAVRGSRRAARRTKSGAETWKRNSARCRPWPSATSCRSGAPPIGTRWRCSTRRCTAAAPGESIANWCWKNRWPSKPTAASTIFSATTAQRR